MNGPADRELPLHDWSYEGVFWIVLLFHSDVILYDLETRWGSLKKYNFHNNNNNISSGTMDFFRKKNM